MLIDRKYGHGTSIFEETDEVYDEVIGLDEFEELGGGKIDIINQSRVDSLVIQAQRQLSATTGIEIRIEWQIQTDLGAKGIQQEVFDVNGITKIKAVHK